MRSKEEGTVFWVIRRMAVGAARRPPGNTVRRAGFFTPAQTPVLVYECA